MDKPMIGIRQADGSFYEILDETAVGHKRLILSAARSDQKGVRIELFRSVDGTAAADGSIGSIVLEDAEGVGGKNIEFRLDLNDGRLEASAALPGQPPQTLSVDLSTEDAPRRTDAAILEDDALGTDLDTLDDSFSQEEPELEPTMIDLPDLRDESEAGAPASFDMPDLDDTDLELPGLDEPEAAAPEDEPFDMPAMDEPISLDEPTDSFDMPDMESETGFDEPAPAAPESDSESDAAFSLDDLGDMEPMEFMDTGAELSTPTPKPAAATEADFDVSMETESDSEFGDLSDLGDLPEMDMGEKQPDDDLDFMAPPELTETPWADEPEEAAVPVGKPGKAGKKPKLKAPKSRARDVPLPAPQGGLDKTALFLSLVSLSLLVLLILVLLFLNMIKSPQPTVIQPEVMKFTPSAPLAQRVAPVAVDLAAGTTFEASTVLEVPAALRVAEISLTLAPGDTAADAERRFGPPAKARGNQLFW